MMLLIMIPRPIESVHFSFKAAPVIRGYLLSSTSAGFSAKSSPGWMASSRLCLGASGGR